MRNFMSNFEVGGTVDGNISREEFINYYANLGANIDNEDYFELMIRNAWHMSGGSGQAANTANRRVLVKGRDGREYVQEVAQDLGVSWNDRAGYQARLRSQGVEADEVSLYGGYDDRVAATATVPIDRLTMGSLRQSLPRNTLKPDYISSEVESQDIGMYFDDKCRHLSE